MTPLAAMGEAVQALRSRISKNETRIGDFEKAVTEGFVTQADYINDLFTQVEALKVQNRDLRKKLEAQGDSMNEILNLVEEMRGP